MKIKIRKRYLFFVLAFSSAIIAALNSGVDAVAGNLIDNFWILSVSCFILAAFASLLYSGILTIPFKGKSIGALTFDPSFKGVRLIQKKELF